MTLTQKYAALKKRVGGNREVMGYEETFGMPREEQGHITMPNKFIRRILGEIEFAIRLSGVQGNKFDSEINAALDYLTSVMDEEGVLTKTACFEAENMLMPLSAAAKEYKLILAGHAHIDMNWMWSWQETVAATLATFRTMLTIMDEYPEFCFSQSQASVYKIVEDFDPELMDKIKARIAEGRWEITASAWVETDKNMPNTESLLRHIKYTKNYLRDVWGVNPDSLEVDFSPDTFGHSANVPEIDTHGGVKYYYHCRALDGKQALYRWRGQSGAELLCYREQYWYNSGITPKIGVGLIDISQRCAGFKTGLIVYGVGDHGGGPTRRDVERAIEMMDWKIFPQIKFGTFHEFFKEAESVRELLPVEEHELNYFAPGCYTTQSRIKRGNRHSEMALTEAETLSAFAAQRVKSEFRGHALECAWRDVLFTHFHDILTGSCVQDSREHAMGLYSNSIAVANTQYSNAMRVIADATDTSGIEVQFDPNSQAEGAGAGYNIDHVGGVPVTERGGGLTRIFTVFNPAGVAKSEPVEITVWDWTGDMRYIKVTDADGNPIEFQLIDHGLQHYWDHKYFRFLAYVNVAALGYTTVVLSQREIDGNYPVYYQPDGRSSGEFSNYVLENEFIRAEFDKQNGALISLKDKETDIEYIKQNAYAGFVEIDTERHSSNAWNIGHYLDIHPINKATQVRGDIYGGLRRGFYYETKILSSTLRTQVYLDKNARALTIKTKVDWNEVGGETVPVLAYMLPLANGAKEYRYNIPAGTIVRAPRDEDVPGLSYGAAIAECDCVKRNIAIVTDSKYGFRGTKNGELVSTLINTATSPDPYPERGIHEITLSVGLFDKCPRKMEQAAQSINWKLTYAPTGSHKGTLPTSGAMFGYDCPRAVISSVGRTDENDGYLVRMYSTSDTATTAVLTFENDVKSARAVDLMGKPTGVNVTAEGGKVCVDIAPHSIVTVEIK